MDLQQTPLKHSQIEIEIHEEIKEDNSTFKRIPLDRESRKGNWTGSKFKALMACNNAGGKMDWFNKEKVYAFSDGALKYIYASAMERQTGRYLETDSTKQMKYGTKVEPLIFKRAGIELAKIGIRLEQVGFKPFAEIPTAGVTSDSIALDENGVLDGSFESKACASWTTLFERTYEKTDDKSTDFWQTQGQMSAWDVKKNYYCVISPPSDINRYIYCENIMDLYDEWCSETEMNIEIIEQSPIHQEALRKRIIIAESVVERFLAGDKKHLKEILYEEIDYWRAYWQTDNQDLLKIKEKLETNEIEQEMFHMEPQEEQEFHMEPQEETKPIEVDMNDLPF